MLIESRWHQTGSRHRRDRRWFSSHDLELTLWFDQTNALSGFQLCYHRDGEQRALTWKKPGGFDHSLVDEGDDSPLSNQTPILEPDGAIPWGEIATRFEAQDSRLDPPLRKFVRDRLSARS